MNKMKDMKLTNIQWLREGVVVVQECEHPFQARKGLSTLESKEIFRSEHLPQAADHLKDLGIDLVTIGGFNAMGYDSDDEFTAIEKKMAGYVHERGMKVGAYVQTIGTLIYEPLSVEEPDCINWAQLDYLGRRPTYYNSYWRYIPCINNENYLSYMEKGLKYAVENLDTDLVFFDNYGYYSFACTCDDCIKAFGTYLKDKYTTRQERMERFGFASTEGIKPPVFADGIKWAFTDPFQFVSLYDPGVIADPVQQEWIDFRCERLGIVSKRIFKYLKGLKANIGVVWNAPYMGPCGGINNAVFHGVWPTSIYPHCDAFSAEADQGILGAHADGKISTRIRTFKMARAFKRGVWMTNFHRQNILLDLCESMAYNPFVYNTVGTPGLSSLEPETVKYIEFFKKNRDILTDTVEMKEAALLNSYASLSYDTIAPLMSLIYVEETLIRSKIPYSVIYDEELDDISEYPLLILANVKYLSDKQIDKIRVYVSNGGSLVATDQTSLLDEKGRRRKGMSLNTIRLEDQKYGLEDVLGIKWPTSGGVVKGTYGKGRYALIPRVKPHKEDVYISEVRHSIGPGVPYLKSLMGYLPENHKEILDAIEWAAKGKETFRAQTEGAVTAQVLMQEGRIMIHLVNYDHDNSAEGVECRLRLPDDFDVGSMQFLSPEQSGETKIGYSITENTLLFTVPEFRYYAVVVIG
jgi:hypothetical protein